MCERVKGNPRTAALPVIHISATAIEPQDRTTGLNRGADGYLTEPVDPAVLVATVEAALRYYRARAAAERLARRLALLTAASIAINSAATFDEFLVAAATGTAAVLDGAATALALTPLGVLRTAAVEVPGGPVRLGSEAAPVLDTLSDAVFGSDASIAVAEDRELDWRRGAASTLVLARSTPATPAICIAVDRAVASADQDRDLLTQLGQAAALAYEGMRALSQEHSLAVTLQQSLLPRELPSPPGLEMAARYRPASRHAEIGGDFYEVAELGGRTLIAVGDVTGHSLEAATVMGEVRHALRAYAVEGHGPVEILDRLDAMLQRFHPRDLTTMCLILLDPESGAVDIASAGHIPPLTADARGTRYLDVRGPVLGIGLSRPQPTRWQLEPGALVLLVTDGLIERRGETIDDGMAALAAAVTHDTGLDELCDGLLDRFGRDAQDDIALLAFRRR